MQHATTPLFQLHFPSVRFIGNALLLLFLAWTGMGLAQEQDAGTVDPVALEKAVDALAKDVANYDRDAERFLEKTLKPLLLDPAVDQGIAAAFLDRLAQILSLIHI